MILIFEDLTVDLFMDNSSEFDWMLSMRKPYRKSGPDAIPPSVLEELAMEIAFILQVIFQRNLDTGSLPLEWLNAKMENNTNPVITAILAYVVNC